MESLQNMHGRALQQDTKANQVILLTFNYSKDLKHQKNASSRTDKGLGIIWE